MIATIRWARLASVTVLAAFAMGPFTGAWSQTAPAEAQGNPASDPPGRVARLNYFDGTVTMEPAGANQWSYAQLNRPLTTGDQLWADNASRAELHVGSTALRLDRQTALDIVDLDDTTMQLKVTQGTLAARVRVLPAGQNVEIDTPNVALQMRSAGAFRVDVAPDGSATTVTLRSGNATLYGDGGSFQMSAGQQIRFAGTNLQQQAGGPAPAPDAFDQWTASRDRAEDNSVSARYVSREIPGYEDLDANGTWRNDPTYGAIWVPTVAVTSGWAPYRTGHWAWIAPWGWTWVDDAPWGFAPFHYGRWAQVGGTWAWVPGPVVASRPPCYAPALVAFVGGGGGGGGFHWGINLSIGGAASAGVAWFPLGPGEPWHPAYAYSPHYYNRVNVTNVHNTTIINNTKNIHNTYINQNAPGAVTAVPATAFVRGQSVAQAARPVTAQQIAHAQVGAGAPALAPVRESFTGGLHPASVRQPAALAQRQVIATRAPSVPPAYHDTLAQRFAAGGGRVEGAGEPVVRNAVPAAFAGGERHGGPAAGTPQGFHVIDRAQARPVGPQGAPSRGDASAHEPNVPQAHEPAPHGRQPGEAGSPHGPGAMQANESGRQRVPAAHDNGVPHPNGAVARQQETLRDARLAQGAGVDKRGQQEAARTPGEGPRAPGEGPHVPPDQQHRVAPAGGNEHAPGHAEAARPGGGRAEEAGTERPRPDANESPRAQSGEAGQPPAHMEGEHDAHPAPARHPHPHPQAHAEHHPHAEGHHGGRHG